MKFGVFGTGSVGQTIAGKLSDLGHSVAIGTRDIAKKSNPSANDSFNQWHSQYPKVGLVTLAEAASFGEMLVNAMAGVGSLAALRLAGAENMNGKVLIDIANPLDFSKGMPATLTVCNDSSLGEQIQAEFPEVKLVKTLNTMTDTLMINPGLLPGNHSVFVNGNDEAAKAAVIEILKEFGWKIENVIDLGDVTASRGTEMYLALWLRLWGSLQTQILNVNVVR